VKSSGLLPAFTEFAPGTENVRVVLQASAGVRVRLAGCGAFRPSMFVLRLEPAAGDVDPRPWSRSTFDQPWWSSGLTPALPRQGGAVEYAWLERKPGPYRLTLTTPAEDQPTLQRELTLRAGEVQTLDLELPRELRFVTVRLVDEVAAPIPDDRAMVLVERSDGPQWFGAPVENGAATLLLGLPSCKVLAVAPHRAAVRTVVTGDSTLTLAPAVPLRIHPTTVPSLPDGVSLRIRLEADPADVWRFPFILSNGKGGPTLLAGLSGECTADADGILRAEALVTGHHRLSALLVRESTTPRPLALQPAVVDVADGDRGKDVDVSIPAADLAKALRQLAR